jgi:hypothetical protein
MARGNGFFDNFLSGLLGPKGNLGDYQHAARLYVDNNMRLAPKVKHLYHVVLNINPAVLTNSLYLNRRTINILAKNADLPKYRVQAQTLNQYNRKKVIQTGVQYQPITVEYHDDNAGLTTKMWESYFRWYYQDSNYAAINPDGSPKEYVDAYNRLGEGLNSAYGSSSSQRFRFGLDRPNKNGQFFNSITIFQLHPQTGRSTYTAFTLVNPYIESFEHDNVNQEVSEFSVNRFTFSYESVLYNRGLTEVGNAPAGFAETHYDKVPSPLTVAGGGTSTIFGTGGVIAGIQETVEDFTSGNILSGLIKGANTLNNIQNLNRTEIQNGAYTILENTTVNAIGSLVFPQKSANSGQTIASQKRFD